MDTGRNGRGEQKAQSEQDNVKQERLRRHKIPSPPNYETCPYSAHFTFLIIKVENSKFMDAKVVKVNFVRGPERKLHIRSLEERVEEYLEKGYKVEGFQMGKENYIVLMVKGS